MPDLDLCLNRPVCIHERTSIAPNKSIFKEFQICQVWTICLNHSQGRSWYKLLKGLLRLLRPHLTTTVGRVAVMRTLWALILGWSLTVTTAIGNGLVISLIWRKSSLKTTTNWFVLSLAVADFGVGALYFPRYSFCSIHDKDCVNQAVIVVFSLGAALVFASLTNLCTLMLDRYLAIVHPLRYFTLMTKRRLALLISAAWSLAGFVFISFLVCLLGTSGSTHQVIAKFITLFLMALSIFACIFLLFASIRIFLIARKHGKQRLHLMTQLSFNHNVTCKRGWGIQDPGATKMMGTVVIMFLFCYLLDIYVNCCTFGRMCPVNSVMIDFNVLTQVLNSAINPVAYAFFKRDVRRELRRMFACKQRCAAAHKMYLTKEEQGGGVRLVRFQRTASLRD